jgi:LemA protein
MSKAFIGIGVAFLAVIGIGLIGVMWYISTGNKLVRLDEQNKEAWSQVENQYQRRFDLIPNLVETVKGYVAEEKEIFEKVAEARAQIGQMKVTPETLNDPAAFKKYQDAQGQLGMMVSRLLVITENYPQLKAQANFQELQAQLEGTENRISVERKRFNDVVREYNTAVRVFPSSFVAGQKGFKEKPYFEAEAGSNKAPKVNFGTASAAEAH